MSMVRFYLALAVFCFAHLSAEAAQGVAKQKVAIRLFPEPNAQVVEDLAFGSKVDLLQESSGWLLIQHSVGPKSIKGWVPAEAILQDGKAETSAPTNSSSPKVSSREERERSFSYRMSSDPYTSFFFPTALPREKGTFLARGHYFLGWQFEYSILEQTTLGLHLTVPIGIIGFGPQLKQSVSIGENFHLGLTATGGALFSLWEKKGSHAAYYFVSGGMATIGNADYGVTLGSYILGGKINNYGHIILADVNAHARVTERVKLMVDFFSPLAYSNSSKAAFAWSVITYGARIGGQSLAADVGFSIPIYDKATKVLRYMPLGIPYISMTVFF